MPAAVPPIASQAVVRSPWARLAVWMAFALVYLDRLFDTGHLVGAAHDLRYVTFHDEAARRTILQFGEYPAWNPFYCGGIPGVPNLQSMTLSPSFLLVLVFGVQAGIVLTIYCMQVFGMEGLYRYARRHGAGGLGGVFTAICGACGGFFAETIVEGHVTWWSYLLIPWALLALEEGIDKPAWRIAGGVFVAWMLMDGGANCVIHAALVLALVCAYETARRAHQRSRYRPALSLITMAVVCVAVSAIKLLPAAVMTIEHRRLWEVPDNVGLGPSLASIFLPRTGAPPGSLAGAYYLGGGCAALMAVGALLRPRPVWRAVLLFAMVTSIAMGNFAPWAPWSLLQKLPIIEDLRAPHRMMLIAGFFAAVAGGCAVAGLERLLLDRARGIAAMTKGRLRRWVHRSSGALSMVVPLAVVVAALWSPIQQNRARFAATFSEPPPVRVESPFRQALGNRWDAQVWVFAGMGTLQCFEETPYPMSASLRGDLAQEERAEEPGAATVRRLAWSPHHIRLAVDAQRDAVILVNQNGSRWWTTSVGDRVERGGLLAVRVPAGRHTVDLRYEDRLSQLGFAISALGWAAILLAAWRRRRRQRSLVGGAHQ